VDELVLGPLLRYVDETTGAIWVETRSRGKVVVRVGERAWSAATFAVHGHHYALVEIDGLEPGSSQRYTVEIDGVLVWPPPDSPLPPSRIATLRPDQELRMAFGSCRMSLPHDAEANNEHGVDALRAYARNLASGSGDIWPDLLLLLGDQVYADETSKEMQEFIEARRGLDEPPGKELKDFEEYTHLYHLAWTEPTNRWLLSTVPSAMIFDDHDIRDDWNTSAQWRREMAQVSWWPSRIVGGLASYWIYQHLGNLSPAERAVDEIWSQIVAAADDDVSRDWGEVLDAFAARADEHPDSYRWSFARDIGANRIIVVDSRAARVLQPEVRSILDPAEMEWLDAHMQGGFDHVFVGTSLPFLLSRGLHHFEAWNEAVATGAWGKRAAVRGEKLRRGVDLEHWAAFHDGFLQVAEMTTAVANGKRGKAPGTVTFLSGDVHHSYIAEARLPRGGGRGERSRILQAVCSPIRNQLPRKVKAGMAMLSHGAFTPLTWTLARLARVPRPELRWDITHGPWYDNNLATVETRGRRLAMKWEAGTATGDDADEALTVVAEFT
jgi:hypothetical protein